MADTTKESVLTSIELYGTDTIEGTIYRNAELKNILEVNKEHWLYLTENEQTTFLPLKSFIVNIMFVTYKSNGAYYSGNAKLYRTFIFVNTLKSQSNFFKALQRILAFEIPTPISEYEAKNKFNTFLEELQAETTENISNFTMEKANAVIR